jgi:hypothetical protein
MDHVNVRYPAKYEDALMLTLDANLEEIAEAEAYGFSSFMEAITTSIKKSEYSYVFEDEEKSLLGMAGIHSYKSGYLRMGNIWMVPTAYGSSKPVTLVKLSKRFLNRWQSAHDILYAHTDSRHKKAARLLDMLGLHVTEVVKNGDFEILRWEWRGE